MKTTTTELANAIRALSMDAVQAANSGHPGMPMGMAEIAVALWNRHLRHNPANPKWADRDRFVLSNGHGSMLLYSLLHLTGYALPMDELRRFRQLHSMTPGHPEVGVTPGVETTTGPLGQGIANAVGMALAEAPARRRVQPAGPRDRRPSHLRFPRRRLPDGRHFARGLLARRHARAGQADRALRRQRHLHRRQGEGLVHRRHAEALRGLRLARHSRSGRPRRRRGGSARFKRGQGGDGPAQPHLLQDGHRQGFPEQGRLARRARRGAGRKGSRGHARGDRLELPAVRSAAERLRGLGRARARRGVRARMERALRRLREAAAGTRARVPAAHGGRIARGLEGALRRAAGEDRRQGRDHRHAQGFAECDRRPGAGAARIRRRLGRPHRVEPHQLVRREAGERIRRRQLHFLRRARIRHGGDRERHGAARRAHSRFAAPSSPSPTMRATRCAWRR